MKTTIPVLFVVASILLVEGCAKEAVIIEDKPNYADYSPGYTGYSQGFDGYGDYDNGYGPSFWNPRNYFYTGYHHGYGRSSDN